MQVQAPSLDRIHHIQVNDLLRVSHQIEVRAYWWHGLICTATIFQWISTKFIASITGQIKALKLSAFWHMHYQIVIGQIQIMEKHQIQDAWRYFTRKLVRIAIKYKASKDAAAADFLKRSFSLSDFYEAKMKKEADGDDGDHSDGGDGDDDDHVDPNLQKPGNKHISENKYPTEDARIDLLSEDELIKLIASLEARIQASTLGIGSMERYYTDPVYPFIHDALGQKVTYELAQWGGFNKNPVNSTTTSTTTSVMESKNPMNTTSTASTSAMELKPPLPVKCPMLPSAWILNSELQKKI
ncbi:hypothetical protein PS1_044940 [Malus domestica]